MLTEVLYLNTIFECTMKFLNYFSYWISIMIYVSPEVTYKIKEMEKCYGNEKFVRIEYCNYTENFFFHIKVHLLTPLDSILVSQFKSYLQLAIHVQFFSKTQVRVSLFKKDSNGKFRELFSNPAVEWCDIMSVKASTSIKATSFMMKLSNFFFKSRFPEFFRKCPFKPFTVDRSNITMDSRIIAMIPTGVYRVRIVIMYKKDDMVFDLAILANVS